MKSDVDYCAEVRTDPLGETWSDGARAHAADCTICIAGLEAYATLSDRLQALPSSRATLPDALRLRLLDQLDEASAEAPAAPAARIVPLRPSAVTRRLLVPAAMAASLVLGLVLGNGLRSGPSPFPVEVHKTIGMYIEDVTHDHFLLERLGRPLEVEITDAGRLSTWLSESLNFDFQVPGSRPALALQGGRVWHTVGRLSALASYETGTGERVLLFAVPAENLELRGAETRVIGSTTVFQGIGWGHEARVWIRGDLALALTAPEGALPAGWEDAFLP